MKGIGKTRSPHLNFFVAVILLFAVLFGLPSSMAPDAVAQGDLDLAFVAADLAESDLAMDVLLADVDVGAPAVVTWLQATLSPLTDAARTASQTGSVEALTHIYMMEGPSPSPSPSPAAQNTLIIVAVLTVGTIALAIVSRQSNTGSPPPTDSGPFSKGRTRYPRDGVCPAPLGA